MKFIIQRTSDDALGFEHPGLKEEKDTSGYTHWTIELTSLEELRDLFLELGEDILLQHNCNYVFDQEIVGVLEIYDDYRE